MYFYSLQLFALYFMVDVYVQLYTRSSAIIKSVIFFSETETPATEGSKGDSFENEHASGGVIRQRLFPVKKKHLI